MTILWIINILHIVKFQNNLPNITHNLIAHFNTQSSFWPLGLLREGWGMAERQQTFAWNHRDVCAGVTGTNITITLILTCFENSFASNDVTSCLMHTMLMSLPLFCSCSGWPSPWPYTSRSTGRERSTMPRRSPVLNYKNSLNTLCIISKPRFMPSQTITTEKKIFLSLSDLIM